jgi:hypothetical protein
MQDVETKACAGLHACRSAIFCTLHAETMRHLAGRVGGTRTERLRDQD